MKTIIQRKDGSKIYLNFSLLLIPIILFMIFIIVMIATKIYENKYQKAYDECYQAVLNQESITLPHQSYAYMAALKCCFGTPELFTVDSITYTKDSKNYQFTFNYNSLVNNYEENLKIYNELLNKIVSEKPLTITTDRAIVTWIHDYLVVNYEYGSPSNALSLMDSGIGNCQAHTALFLALCEKFDIPCSTVRSDAINHTWNTVKIDGKWYFVDTTWDDLGGEDISYQNFLVGSAEMIATGHHLWYSTGGSALQVENFKRVVIICLLVSLPLSLIPFFFSLIHKKKKEANTIEKISDKEADKLIKRLQK